MPSACPYQSAHGSSILASGVLCQGAALCYVDASCKVSWRGTPDVDLEATTNVAGLSAIGDMRAWTNPRLAIVNSSLPLVVDAAAFAPSLQFLKLSAVVLSDLACMAWPSNLTELTLETNGMKGLPPRLPDVSTFNYINNTFPDHAVTSNSGLPTSITSLQLRRNNLKRIEGVDWTNIKSLNLGLNPISTFSFVQFTTSRLKYFNCHGCEIQNITLDEDAYTALNNLPPVGTGANANLGFAVANASIVANAPACALQNGVITELWKQYKTPSTFTVCVVINSTVYTNFATRIAMGNLIGKLDDGASPARATTSTVLIASLAIGCAVLLAGVLFLLLKHRKDKPGRHPTQLATASDEPSSHYSVAYQDILESHYGILNLAEIALYRLPAADVIPLKLLASGATADVFLGDYNGAPVAIKQLLTGHATTRNVGRLVDEIKLLASFESPYIVALLGVTWDRPIDLKCVLEYMDGGDLRDHLTRTNHASFPWHEKLQCILSVVEGLVYLHSLDIIHRDIKSRNVLMDETKGAKLTDFGVSCEDTQVTMTIGVGTYRWMAPEILQFNHYSVAADIYSFGMLLSELDSHTIPYATVLNEKSGKPLVDTAIMGLVMLGSLRPTFTYTTPLWLQDIATQCLAATPEHRPSAIAISSIVRQHLKEDHIL